MKFILGTKQEMTQVFDESGRALAATIVVVPKTAVVGVRTNEKDGYAAVQVGAGEQKLSRIKKPQQHFGTFRFVREFRVEDASDFETGKALDVSLFAPGDVVSVSGVSKGKGFQGVVKRHGFHGGPRSHGQKHSEREPGSIGAGGVQRVYKGTRMAGRMGSDRVTVSNLRVLHVDPEKGLIMISGAIPGRRGTLLEIVGN